MSHTGVARACAWAVRGRTRRTKNANQPLLTVTVAWVESEAPSESVTVNLKAATKPSENTHAAHVSIGGRGGGGGEGRGGRGKGNIKLGLPDSLEGVDARHK